MMSTARPDEITQSLPIPEYKMGWIVGKKGSYINQLSRKSGAHISISETSTKEYGIVWKYVQITGTGRPRSCCTFVWIVWNLAVAG